MSKRRIAILGGGVGALTAAFAITDREGWQNDFEVTVYQLGWRLGGKGASGRGPCGRIEEHGLHIWLGFYNNAFRVMQKCYAAMNRPHGAPLATWTDAFKKHSLVGTAEYCEGKWDLWNIDYPENNEVPGEPEKHYSILEYASLIAFAMIPVTAKIAVKAPHTLIAGESPHIEALLAQHKLKPPAGVQTPAQRGLHGLAAKLSDLHNVEQEAQSLLKLLWELIEEIGRWLSEDVEQIVLGDPDLRHLFVMLDIGLATIKGFLAEGLPWKPEGLSHLDRYDLREFLQKYGAHGYTLGSGQIAAIYDFVFAYEDGDGSRPSLAAGIGMRGMLRMAFTYKGAIFYKMQAGMGDTVFTPIYETLKARGVKFRFFSKVQEIVPSADGNSIERLRIEQQVDLKNDDPYSYEPSVEIAGLPCWPAQPVYQQIKDEQAEALQKDKINLESFWTPWKGKDFELLVGQDFDDVVMGISLGSIPYTAPKLKDFSPRWKDMVDNLKTTRTMALQAWFKPDMEKMGNIPGLVIAGYAQYMNTWADMSQLLCRETWPPDNQPLNVSYLCGTMIGGIPDPNDPEVPKIEMAAAKESIKDWIKQYTGFLWPGICDQTDPCTINLDDLAILPGYNPQDPLASQFFRVNIDPSERYNLSLPGKTMHRIWPNQTGFTNMVVAGDWTRNGIDAGCVEAAAVSGLKAAQAIAGYPRDEEIIGFGHV